MTEQPKVKVALELVVEIDPEAWEHVHNGEWKLNQATALAYVMQMFEADAKGTGITQVVHLEATDPETGENVDEDGTCPDCGDSMDEDDEGNTSCPNGCENV
ncbi:hypothetical protein SEA_KEANU_105 [Streptomyces phage Keanu]|nr:hypothetical protein SEA_KEANU_105 [Streptomyces phage Keanu]